MSSDNVKTITAIFDTREAADRAIEHLVQQHGIERTDIFAEPVGNANTSGTAASGGDVQAETGGSAGSQPVLAGEIQVSVDVGSDEIDKAQAAFHEIGAKDVSIR